MLIIDHNHLCFFAGVLHDEIYHQNEFFGSLTLQTENHRGGDDFGSAAKIIPPYIKCLILNIITCAFLQVFYRMRYITRMSFFGSLTKQTENHRGVMISAVLPKSYPPT